MSRAYLTRVALGSEPLDSVFSAVDDGNKDAVTLSFVIAGHLLTAFFPADLEWSGYLTVLEEMYEAATRTNLALPPAVSASGIVAGRASARFSRLEGPCLPPPRAEAEGASETRD